MTTSGRSRPGHGMCLWFTGLPCAGKTTIAHRLAEVMEKMGKKITVLDSDAIRPILCPDLGYAKEDRLASLTRLAFVAQRLVEHGAIVAVCTITPYEEHRCWLRNQFPTGSFAQVYVQASLKECERRDVKGMYAEARRGKRSGFTGVQSPFEEPAWSEVVCATEHEGVDACVQHIVSFLFAGTAAAQERQSA